ncbi:MAG TPA: hypothetical protein VGM37_20045 [Armatimonadota bacterium]|jgi:hypothetical protein
MAIRLDRKRITVSTSTSPLALVHGETDPWEPRYLTVNGDRAFDMGNHCGTCSFLFERLEGAPNERSPGRLDGALRSGLRRLDDAALNAASPLIPKGEYDVILLAAVPRLVSPFSDADYFFREQADLWGAQAWDYWTGLPHFTHTAYYRLPDIAMGKGEMLFQFIVPLIPPALADEKTVKAYMERLEAAESPTALAVSVLDVKQPAVWGGDQEPEITKHWCLAHFLVDGHHKVCAAARAHRPITLLSYLDRNEGASSPDEIDAALAVLSAAPGDTASA